MSLFDQLFFNHHHHHHHHDDYDLFYAPPPAFGFGRPQPHKAAAAPRRHQQHQHQHQHQHQQHRPRPRRPGLFRGKLLAEQQEREQQQQQQQQQHRRRDRRQAEQQRSRARARARVIVRAACVIQTAWREHRRHREDEAARVITSFLRRVPAVLRARRVLAALRDLAGIEAAVRDAHDLYDKAVAVRPRRAAIQLEEDLVKLTIKADAVETRGADLVRAQRKQLVRLIQARLSELDSMSEETETEAEIETEHNTDGSMDVDEDED